jgi:hypothetical protein
VVLYRSRIQRTTQLFTSCCVVRATPIVLCQTHNYVMLSPMWHRWTTIGAIKFQILKIINLFDSTSVYPPRPRFPEYCSRILGSICADTEST